MTESLKILHEDVDIENWTLAHDDGDMLVCKAIIQTCVSTKKFAHTSAYISQLVKNVMQFKMSCEHD